MSFKFLFKLNVAAVYLAALLKYWVYFFTDHYKFTIVRRNKELSSSRKSDTCYICALGPSLKKVDLDKIEGDTIVVNRFHRIGEKFPNFVPTYYVLADAAFGTKYKDEMDFALNKYLSQGTKFILNSRFGKIDLLQNDKIFYYSAFKGTFVGQKYRIDKVMPAFANVVGVSIGLAMGMGYKKVVLLGCDFSSFASPVSNHCYAEANYTRQIELWYELYRYSLVAWGHENLAKYARKHGVEIINSTKGSLIDAYPFVINESLYIAEA